MIGMGVFAGAVILLCAEPFAEALVATGESLHVSEFLLVQWLAPLASEAPELLVAGLYAWRLNTNAGLGTLVSSKVNQWTLLVGHAADRVRDRGRWPPRAADRQRAAGGAVPHRRAVVLRGRGDLEPVDVAAARRWCLFGLFWAQFILGAIVPESLHALERIGVGIVYLVLAAWVLIGGRSQHARSCSDDGFRASYAELSRRAGDGRREAARRATVTGAAASRPGRSLRPWTPAPSSTRSRGDEDAQTLARARARAAAALARRSSRSHRAARPGARPARLTGVTGLYPHQARASRRSRPGATSCMATGTASGKTLVYNVAFARRGRRTRDEGHRAVPVPHEGARARSAPRGPLR